MIEYRIRQTKAGYTVQIYEGKLHLLTSRYRSPQEVIDLFVKNANIVVFKENSAPRRTELEGLIRQIQRAGYKATVNAA